MSLTVKYYNTNKKKSVTRGELISRPEIYSGWWMNTNNKAIYYVNAAFKQVIHISNNNLGICISSCADNDEVIPIRTDIYIDAFDREFV